MMSVDDTIKERVAEEHVRVRHVNLRTKHLLTFCIFSSLHFTEKLEVLLNATVTVRALCSWYLHSTTTCTDLLLCLVIYICKPLLDEFLCPLVKLIEVVRSVTLIFPLETEPLDVLLDRVYVLSILLYRVCIVKAEVCLSAIFLSKSEVDADTLRMSDVKVAVRFWRETCHNGFMFSAGEIRLNNFFQKVEISSLSYFFVYLFHIFGNNEFQIILRIYGFFSIFVTENQKIINMIKSMTGYGKAEAILETGKITVEVRSLNGKTADISIKTSMLPKDKEMTVRQKIAAALTRGNIDFFVTYEPNAADSAKKINMDLAMEYYSQLFELGSRIGKANKSIVGAENLWTQGPNDLLSMIMRMPEVMDVKKQDVITDENWPLVEACIDQALANINAFRAQEGEVLYKDVTSKVNNILEFSKQVETYEQERVDAIREKILNRFAELKAEPDQSRLEQEMIFYIEKLDLNEERVRLRQHCRYFLETLDNEPNPGKKLGFIAQEMGREINTTGSKANHTEIQKLVVKMKDELEKIKEQSLNIL